MVMLLMVRGRDNDDGGNGINVEVGNGDDGDVEDSACWR